MVPKTDELAEGYELDIMAKKINECKDWRILTVPLPEACQGKKTSSEISNLASRVVQSRIRLTELSGWPVQFPDTIEQVSQTIQAIMNHLFRMKGDVAIKNDYQQPTEFAWTLPVSVLRDSTTDSGELRIMLRRTKVDNKWTPWQVNRNDVEAIFSLWMSHFPAGWISNVAPNLWVIGPDNILNRITYDWWICRGTPSIQIQNAQDCCGVDKSRIFNLGRIYGEAEDLDSTGEELLGIVIRAHLQQSCGQYLVGSFLKSAIHTVERLEGKTEVTTGADGYPFTLVNESIRGIAETMQQYGLASAEDSYRLVVPRLDEAGMLQDPFDILEDIVTAYKRHEDIDDLSQPKNRQQESPSQATHQRLIHLCNRKAQSLSLQDRWADAGRTYMRLITVLSDVLGPQDDRTVLARQAMKQFARNFVDEKYQKPRRGSMGQPNKLDNPFRLHAAAARGYLDLVHKALEEGVGVDTWDDEHETPISLAIKHGHLDVVRLVIFYGAPVDRETLYGAIDEKGQSLYSKGDKIVEILLLNLGDKTQLLLEAAAKGYNVMMRLLVSTGIDVAVKDKDGFMPLHIASKNGSEGVAEVLLSHGADVAAKGPNGQTALHLAVTNGDIKLIQLLVDNGASVVSRDERGWTPLHLAADGGFTDIVRLLVAEGGDPNGREQEGLTALHLAAKKGHCAVVQWLIEHGVDQKQRDNDQMTALHWAAKERHESVVKLLAQDKANLVAKDKYGRDALNISAREDGRESVTRILVERGADMTSREDSGRGCLEYAALQGHVEVARVLIENRAPLDNKDGFGRMALHYASMGGHVAMVRLLVQKGVDVDAVDKDGWTALHYASRKGDKEVEQVLRNAGANTSCKDRLGHRPSHYFEDGGEANFWTRALPPPYPSRSLVDPSNKKDGK